MRGDERVDAVGVCGTGEFAVEVVPPEDAGIAVAGEDEGVAEHLVVDDFIAAHVVIFDEGDGIEGARGGTDSPSVRLRRS
jgi:hypothetical protein